MNKSLQAIAVTLFIFSSLHAQTPATSAGFNYSSFTTEKKIITPELQSLTDKKFQEHPEYGVLPYNAPCADCFELLQKRDATHRYFVKNGSHGKEFYQQTAYSNLSYEENGVLHTIDPRLQPTTQKGVFDAKHQPSPVTINISEKFTSILNAGKELQVNRNITIFIRHSDGSETSLGEPDWSHYTAGDNGVVIHNFYPGIDLELHSGSGNIESFYRLNKPLHLSDGWLVIRDNMKVPQGLAYDHSHSEKFENNYYGGRLYINNADGTHCFSIASPAAYDENNDHENTANLNYQITDKGAYDLYVPINWMNDSKRSYPLIIDPLVIAIDSLPAASINSSYSDTCFAVGAGCPNNLNVVVPPACVITDISTTFIYDAFNPCKLTEGGWDILYGGGCRYPQAGTWHTCGLPLPGACELFNEPCYNQFHSCLPAPGCNADTLVFTLEFYRCVQPAANCNSSCISGDNYLGAPWSMTVTGRTPDANTASAVIMCPDSGIRITATDSFAIGPFSYLWYPGGSTNSSILVSPASTTTYTVTVKDYCGNSDTNAITVIVDSVKTPASISSSSVIFCAGDTVLLNANVGAGLNYQWQLNGEAISGAIGSVYYATSGGNYNCVVGSCGQSLSNTITIAEDSVIASFTISADSTQLHHYIAVNNSSGIPPLSYHWSWGDGGDDYIPYPSHTYADTGLYFICLTVTDSIGCQGSFCDGDFHALRTTNYMVYVNVIPPVLTGTKEIIQSQQRMNIYPNPANDRLSININGASGNSTITVFNMLGEIMQEEKRKWSNETSITIKTLPAGIYFVQVQNEKGKWVERFVKE